MFDFNYFVSNSIVFEADTTGALSNLQSNPGFNALMNAYKTKFNITPDLKTVESAINIIQGGKYIAAKYTSMGFIPFLDAFAQIYTLIPDDKKKNFTLQQIIDNIINDNSGKYNDVFNSTAQHILNLDSGLVSDYIPSNPAVNRAWLTLSSEANKLSQAAIQSLQSDTIYSAIQKIIAKRTGVIDRITNLKGIVKPFNISAISPVMFEYKKFINYTPGKIFTNPKNLLPSHWQKKIPGDFNKIVEGLTADNLIKLAIFSSEYYIHLLRNKFTAEQQQQIPQAPGTTPPPAQAINTTPPPAGESLSIFDAIANSILLSEVNTGDGTMAGGNSTYTPVTPQTPQQNNNVNTSTTLDERQIEQISNVIGSGKESVPDYKNFITKGVSSYLGDIKYDLGTIAKDPSKEARALYKALTDIAYFTNTSTSTADRLKYANQALDALAGMGGAKLYVGS
jgi:hypothetical protein